MNADYIVVPLLFIAGDVITGVCKAVYEGGTNGLSSSVARKGLMHKVSFVLVLALGILIDYAQARVDLGINVPCGAIFAAYIAGTELVSIWENLRVMAPELPNSVGGVIGRDDDE